MEEEIREMKKRAYYNRMMFDLQEKDPDEVVSGKGVFYKEDLYNHQGYLGMIIPIAEGWTYGLGEGGGTLVPTRVLEYSVVLDGIFRGAPEELLEAAVEHEKVHERARGLHDAHDEEMGLAVNAMAFIESGNLFCPAMTYIVEELKGIKDSK